MEDFGDTEVTGAWTFCHDCGLWFESERLEALHDCEPEVVVTRAVGMLECRFRHWLKTPAGQFATFIAQRGS